ncbi:MAG: hypothetical protein RMJ19_06610 [Gemmatales bacterium]|nr:hypothetical protein [Gemmatales bacterium]MDW8175326.1 hypothetical protein [Gemmatales bacterium]
MLERTTFTNLVHLSISHLHAALREVERLHIQAVTGKKLLRPSDNPVGFSTAQAYRSTLEQIETWSNNLRDARLTLQASTQALQQMSGILMRARALASEGAHDTLTEDSRRALAAEVNGLLEQALTLANSRTPDHYVFAGSTTAQPPFQAIRDDQGRIVRVEYRGDARTATAPVAHGEWIRFLYSGLELLGGLRPDNGFIIGDETGLALGTGTSRVQGRVRVLLSHTTTIYAGGSGVAPGASSAHGDTILGPSGTHTLFLQDTSGTGTSGVVWLNGGPTITWTNSDTDLRVVGPHGEVVFIDTTNITPGFAGSVAITAHGTMSLDGGASASAIAFTTDQILQDGQGNVLFLNTASVRRVGENWIEFPQSYDIFTALIGLRDDLAQFRSLSGGEQVEAISRMISAIESAHSRVLHALGEQSATLAGLDTLEEQMQQAKLDLQERLGHLEEADLAELVVQLQARQNLMTLLLGATAMVLQPNLLDFLQ